MTGRVALTVQDGIGQIVLDRPDKHNAITPEMSRELQRVCRAIDDDRDIRVATITGAGDHAFSAGSDLNTSGRPIRYHGVPRSHRIRGSGPRYP